MHAATMRTMVHVPVNNCHPLQSIRVLCLPCSDGDVVEVAEAHGPVAFGVVPRRPHQRVRRPAAAAAQPIVSLWCKGMSTRAPNAMACQGQPLELKSLRSSTLKIPADAAPTGAAKVAKLVEPVEQKSLHWPSLAQNKSHPSFAQAHLTSPVMTASSAASTPPAESSRMPYPPGARQASSPTVWCPCPSSSLAACS